VASVFNFWFPEVCSSGLERDLPRIQLLKYRVRQVLQSLADPERREIRMESTEPLGC
jgi:hypothetical protein